MACTALVGQVLYKIRRKNGLKQDLERSDGILYFAITKLYFEQKIVD
jgi:hypothetical protein